MPDNTTPVLLVPIAAEALVVNSSVQGTAFAPWATDYSKLTSFANPVPQAFSDQNNNPPDQGIHLHWALPRALTHGVQTQAMATAEVFAGKVTAVQVVNSGFNYVDALPPAA